MKIEEKNIRKKVLLGQQRIWMTVGYSLYREEHWLTLEQIKMAVSVEHMPTRYDTATRPIIDQEKLCSGWTT
jgi:hypothetical protein